MESHVPSYVTQLSPVGFSSPQRIESSGVVFLVCYKGYLLMSHTCAILLNCAWSLVMGNCHYFRFVTYLGNQQREGKSLDGAMIQVGLAV